MLLDLNDLIEDFNLEITGVIHLGAHLAEEAQLYSDLGIQEVWWVEGNPGVMGKLQEILAPYGHHLINALMADEDGEKRVFNITNYDGMSSSIFEFGQLHLTSSPDTKFVQRLELETRTLDSLVEEYGISGCNFLNMDLQGAELLVLKGAEKALGDINYIYTEINEDYVYQNCALVGEIDAFLPDFKRVATGMTPARWGDALYVRRD
jgi:FkbM family methyltransferase